MTRSPLTSTPLSNSQRRKGRSILPCLVGVVALTALGVGFGPDWLMSEGSLKTLIAVSLFAAPLCVVLALAKAHALTAGAPGLVVPADFRCPI